MWRVRVAYASAKVLTLHNVYYRLFIIRGIELLNQAGIPKEHGFS